jgi:hypothetical protein
VIIARRGRTPTGTTEKDSTPVGLLAVHRSENRMSKTTRLITSACIAALALGACGSSYKGLSKAEFVKQADALCVKDQAKIDKIGTAVGDNPTLRQVKDTYTDQLIPAYHEQVDHLRELKPPKADRKTISKMLDDLSTGIDQAGDSIASLKSLKELDTLGTPAGFAAADKAAKAYGLQKCGKG